MFWQGKKNKKKEEPPKEKKSTREQETDMMVEELLKRGVSVEPFRLHTHRGICFYAYLPEIKPFKVSLTAWDAQLYLKLYPKDIINQISEVEEK